MKNRIDVKPVYDTKKLNNNKKNKNGNFAAELFRDYCGNASLHGVEYLGSKDTTLLEKIWWTIFLILSIIACAYLINQTWTKWKNNPVILSFEKEQKSIWSVPFPAVTICPVNKVKQTQYNYTKLFRMRNALTDDTYKKFWDVSLVCNLYQYQAKFYNTPNITDKEAIFNIQDVAPNLTSTVFNVQWQNNAVENLFAEQLTEEGVCFTFNSFSQDDMFTTDIDHDITYINHDIKNEVWSIEEGYKDNLKNNDHPRRTSKDGVASGLSVILISNVLDKDYVCGLPILGFKVILHNPADIPKTTHNYFFIPPNKKATFIVKPEMTTTDLSLLNLPADVRKCYFSHEKSLKFFKEYTQNNCRIECDSNITRQYCGCVPFYMPRDKDAPICGYAKMDCMKQVERLILNSEFLQSSNMSKDNKESMDITHEIMKTCDCIPSCTSLNYAAETSQTDNHILKTLTASGLYDSTYKQSQYEELNTKFMTTEVDIFFKESQFMALHRSELYGQVDFVANFGGLLGLFMGFSLLSLVEIVYYLTIRLWIKCIKRHKQ